MNRKYIAFCAVIAAGVSAAPVISHAADWPFWGRSASRNMVSEEKNTPATWEAGRYKSGSEEIDMATTKNVKWIAKLGSQSYGNPTIAGGKIFIGTNNESPRDPLYKGDRAVLLCLDEKTGKMLWQLPIPKLGTGKVSDWEFLGLCSSPAVEGDRVYIVTNRNEVMCLDVNGQANGNDGDFKDEAKYLTDKGQKPQVLKPTDADIIWKFDMREELGVFPHNITNCAPLIIGNKIVVTTSNGVDWTHTNMPNPKAPALCMLDKNTGKYLGEEASGVSSRTLHSNWSSPAGGKVGDRDVILFGGGDGFLYGLDTATDDKDGVNVLKELWKIDANPADRRMKDGKPLKYATYAGPSEVIATPVYYNNRVYVPIGQDPEHGEGLGNFICIDVATGKKVWNNDTLHRSLSTPAIADGLIYVSDFSGFIHCLDAETGKTVWKFDTRSHIWGSPLLADGKVYVGTEDGDLIMIAAGRTMKELGRVDMRSPVYASPVITNGTLYIATPTHLYAIGGSAVASASPAASPAKKAQKQESVAQIEARMAENARKLRQAHDVLVSCKAHGISEYRPIAQR
jgi:outer membrane protein assembly factor BamB